MSNAAAKAWSIASQPTKYATAASFVYSSAATAPVLALLDAQPGEKVLDLGCGTGDLTHGPIHAAVSGKEGFAVVGTDVSASMVAQAEKGALGKTGIEYHAVDGHDLATFTPLRPWQGSFDAVFSNAALHWMKKDPSAVVENVKTMLKPGGRFAAELGGHLNMVGVKGALHAALRRRGVDPSTVDPWYFPTPETYSAILKSHGFRVNSIELVPRPTPLPKGLEGWLDTFAHVFTEPFPAAEDRQAVFDEVVEECRADMYDEAAGGWTVMYVRLRFSATLQST